MAAPRNVVVVGASAGGVEALSDFIRHLPAALPAAVLVVLHVSPGGTSVLPGILARAGRLPAGPAADGEPLQSGRLYVAVPDHHLQLEDGVLRVRRGPRENGHRPAVDPLFRSAASTFGSHAIAVVLSGSRDDGTAGAAAIKAAGGRVAVQDPDLALYPSMPRSVLARMEADGQGSAEGLAHTVAGWLESTDAATMSGAASPNGADAERHEAGEPGASGLTCPECGGAIYLDAPDGVPQLGCHTGHIYSPESFAAEQDRVLEAALWSAVRRLDERAALLRRLADQMRTTTRRSGTYFADTAREATAHADVIRDLIASRTSAPT